MKKSELIQLIKEAIAVPAGTVPAPSKVQGSINLPLFKQLDPNINPSLLSTTINKVKNGSSLSVNDNKILAQLMISMIKTSDDALLTKIFSNLKQLQTK